MPERMDKTRGRRKTGTARRHAPTSTNAGTVSKSTISRRQRVLRAKVDALKKLSEQLDKQLYPPNGIQARSISEWVDIAIAIGKRIYWCAKAQTVLDGIEDTLDKYGDQLSEADRKALNDAGEELWEKMGKAGCFA